MTDATNLRRARSRASETVVHLVAIRQGSDEKFEGIMVQGTLDLLTAAKEAGVKRFVHMSALGTSEESKDPGALLRGQMGDGAGGREHAASPYVIFRPSFVFERDGGILPTFSQACAASRP